MSPVSVSLLEKKRQRSAHLCLFKGIKKKRHVPFIFSVSVSANRNFRTLMNLCSYEYSRHSKVPDIQYESKAGKEKAGL